MDYAVVIIPAAQVRRKARHQSEMINQLLFGETVRILKQKGNLWVKIRSMHDEYEGWMTNTLLKEVMEEEAKAYCQHTSSDFLNTIHIKECKMRVPVGSSLPAFKDGKGK